MHAQEVKTRCVEALLAAGISPKHCQVCEVHAAVLSSRLHCCESAASVLDCELVALA